MTRAGCCPAGRRLVERTVPRRLFLLAAVAAAVFYADDFAGKVVATTHMRPMARQNGAGIGGTTAPEMKQPFGTRQAAYRALAFGQTVTVKVRDIGRYKRTVAEIILPDGHGT